MCGVFAYLGEPKSKNLLLTDFNKLSGRGPDSSKLEIVKSEEKSCIIYGFHRLAINDCSSMGDQPMSMGTNTLICNGEIFNYQQLISENNFEYQSGSDCEIILHMYEKYEMKKQFQN